MKIGSAISHLVDIANTMVKKTHAMMLAYIVENLRKESRRKQDLTKDKEDSPHP